MGVYGWCERMVWIFIVAYQWCAWLVWMIGVKRGCGWVVWMGGMNEWYEWVAWSYSLQLIGPQTHGVRCESHGDHSHLIFTPFKHTRAHTHMHTQIHVLPCISCICVRRMEYMYSVCIAHVFDGVSVSGLAVMEYGIVVVRISCIPCVLRRGVEYMWNTLKYR